MSRSRRTHSRHEQRLESWERPFPPELCGDPKALTAHQREEGMREFKRRLIDFYELHQACPHLGCRRAHRCARPDVQCFGEAEPLFREKVYPWLLPALEQRVADKGSEAAVQPESPL